MRLTVIFRKAFFVFAANLLALASVNGAEIDARMTPVVKVVKEAAGSVVNISTEKVILLQQNPVWGVYGNDLDVLFNRFYAFHGMAPALKLKSVGSGVIVDKTGLIATNAHVVNMASSIFVILNDGKQAKGEVVYEDRNDDLAFIKITPPKPLVEAVLGQTGDLMLGETVVAIGNPLGLENTVTSGIVSGKNRKFYSAQGDFAMNDMLQIDAPINPGNSGGALFNLNGKLIGINVAVVEYSQSIGFAIPVEKLKQSLEEYRRNESIPVHLKKQDSVNFGDIRDNLFENRIFHEINLNMEEAPGEYVLKLDISGLDKDKVKAHISSNLITLTGEYSSRVEEKSPAGSRGSQSFGSFVKTVPLPADADPNGVKTEIKDDTLIMHIAKKHSK
ncbi:MAG: trypsin-like peptidase domain-containing protein [Candidatus Omnitrophica bacterium]|nr:trypsin-like peptidase domain-containing protein [Candidatus Omnitrophota bacterium]